MKWSIYLIASAGTTLAFPGIGKLMVELAKRQGPISAPILIGDLALGATTSVGIEVKNCLLGTGPCENLDSKTYTAPGALGSFACAQDTCCVWNYVQEDLVKLFTNTDGTCNDLARASVRLGFHDAGSWSTSSGYGGADGSLILSFDEIKRPENNGLQKVRQQALSLLGKYALFGVGAADLVQFMHNVATVVCPLGPRVLTLVGRSNSLTSNPTDLLPDTHSPAQVLIDLFGNKTISADDLLALIGAHSTAHQSFVDPSRAGQPLDSTPGVWDVQFYSETLLPNPPEGVYRLPSDQTLVDDAGTQGGFVAFSGATGQADWNTHYARAYVRLSLLGVNTINSLKDCTKVLPNPITSFP